MKMIQNPENVIEINTVHTAFSGIPLYQGPPGSKISKAP